MKNVCFVAGQHRSGTSALTGLLKFCGASLGEGHVHEQDQWNQKGYFENKKFEEFNESLLAKHDSWWSDTKDIPDFDPTQEMWQTALEELVALISEQLSSLRDCDKLLVIKDPRISLFVDLYCAAAKQIQEAEFSFIFSQRDVSENIASLVRRGALSSQGPDGKTIMDSSWADQIIDRHNKLFERKFDRSFPLVYHTYSNLFYEPVKYLRHLNAELGLGLDLSDSYTQYGIHNFLDQNLKHEVASKKTAKVIATYFGNRRRWPSGFNETVEMWARIMRNEETVNPGDAMDTIIVLHDHNDERAVQFINSLDGHPTRFGVIKTMVRPWEDGVGASFKSFDFAYQGFKNQYGAWIFDEDNVFMVTNGYLTGARKQFSLDDKIAFIGMMRCDAREPIVFDNSIGGGRLFSNEERMTFPSIWHAHGGCGYTENKYLDLVTSKLGHLPYPTMAKPGEPGDGLNETHPWYRSAEQDGEVMFTAVFHLLGYKVVESDHPLPITYYKYDNSYA